MRYYTCTFYKKKALRRATSETQPVYITNVLAETSELAAYYAQSKGPEGNWTIRVSQGDTRDEHPGAQELLLPERQVDIQDLTYP